MDNSNKIILDLCGGTGAWSRPYLEAGYIVHVLTLPQYDVTNVYMGPSNLPGFDGAQIIAFRGTDPEIGDIAFRSDQIYGVLAAPPCTEFSLAKNGSGKPRDLAAGMEVVEACERIIRHCQLHGNLKFWALENPVGLLRKFMGRPQFTFQQWQYSAIAVKPTDIWGWFNHPTPTVKTRPEGIVKRYGSGKVNTFAWAPPKPPSWLDTTGLTRADLRSITPEGFAKAFFKANK